MNYLNDIKNLIEKDIVLNKKHRLIEEDSRLNVNVNIKMYKKGKITMYKKRNKVCSY